MLNYIHKHIILKFLQFQTYCARQMHLGMIMGIENRR